MLRRYLLAVVVLINVLELARASLCTDGGKPHRILLDTDVDTDDFFALLYLLKLNRSEFELEVSPFAFLVSVVHSFSGFWICCIKVKLHMINGKVVSSGLSFALILESLNSFLPSLITSELLDSWIREFFSFSEMAR